MAEAAEKVRIAPRAVGEYLAQIAMVFAVQFAAGKLAELLPIINSGGVGPVWPASGIALAAFLLFGYQVWPGVAVAAFLLTWLSPIPPVAPRKCRNIAITLIELKKGRFSLACMLESSARLL